MSGSYTYLDVLPGAWDVKIAINAPGRYAIRLEVDGIASPILFFEARSSAARLDVVVQAQPRVDGNASNPGDIFDIQPGNVIILTIWLVTPLLIPYPTNTFRESFSSSGIGIFQYFRAISTALACSGETVRCGR